MRAILQYKNAVDLNHTIIVLQSKRGLNPQQDNTSRLVRFGLVFHKVWLQSDPYLFATANQEEEDDN